MKKTTLLLLAILMTCGLSAQDFKLGIKAGANFTSLKSDQKWLDSENNTGYLIGAWGRIGGGSVHLQPEVYFTNKQTSVFVPADEAAQDLVKGDLKFSNIDVPLLIGTNFPIGPIKARIQAGPLFSFVIDQEASYTRSVESAYEDAIKNYKDRFSAIVGGVGLDIGSIALDVRYEYGLGNFSELEQKQSLKIWTVGIGYSFF